MSCGSRADEIMLCGMNVIGPRPCHQHTGPQLFFDYIREGQRGGEGNIVGSLAGHSGKGSCAPAPWFVSAADTHWFSLLALTLTRFFLKKKGVGDFEINVLHFIICNTTIINKKESKPKKNIKTMKKLYLKLKKTSI